jgi:hypothetical protein
MRWDNPFFTLELRRKYAARLVILMAWQSA